MLLLFSAPWCSHCHHLENEVRNEPGAVAALEANFVPVKINCDYYPNTVKQYGVSGLPTTVILAPTARGEVLAVIPDDMTAKEYLSRLDKVATDAKRRDANGFTQIHASPPIGSPAVLGQPTLSPPAPPANSVAAVPIPSVADAPRPGTSPAPTNVPAPGTMLAMATGPGLPGGHPVDPLKPAENVKVAGNPPFALDGFCPVQLAENGRWQPGKKAWGFIHRGRTYLFAGPEEQSRFKADPDRYAPVSSGDDVVLLLEQGRSAPGYREHGVQFEGHIYLFSSEGTLEKFRSNPHYYADRALQALHSPAQSAGTR